MNKEHFKVYILSTCLELKGYLERNVTLMERPFVSREELANVCSETFATLDKYAEFFDNMSRFDIK